VLYRWVFFSIVRDRRLTISSIIFGFSQAIAGCFDLNQYRTIPIETQNAYTLYPKLQTYTAQVANQVRRALEDLESGDNPISLYYPSARLSWADK
jgi:hypothetical protein